MNEEETKAVENEYHAEQMEEIIKEQKKTVVILVATSVVAAVFTAGAVAISVFTPSTLSFGMCGLYGAACVGSAVALIPTIKRLHDFKKAKKLFMEGKIEEGFDAFLTKKEKREIAKIEEDARIEEENRKNEVQDEDIFPELAELDRSDSVQEI